jgi:hypothetical protein
LAYHSCPDLSVVDPGCFVFLTKDRVLEGHRNGRTLVLLSTGGATGHDFHDRRRPLGKIPHVFLDPSFGESVACPLLRPTG